MLNIFVGGSKEKSRAAISEFICNLSFQVLNKNNTTIELEFEEITGLAREIDRTCLKDLFDNKIKMKKANDFVEDEVNRNVASIFF